MMKRLLSICFVLTLFLSLSSAETRSWWSVYFTTPGRTSAAGRLNPEEALVRLIAGARNSFYGAFYDIDSEKISMALIEAVRRGVDVRLVTERDNADTKEVARLRKNGIHPVSDNRRGFMHNKFAVIDGNTVWTGSYNITDNGARKNNNNAICIASSDLADIFLKEFSEMHDSGIFGNRKEFMAFPFFQKKYYVKIDDSHINAYFSPEDDIERIIIKRIEKAEASIHFMAFSFTSEGIGEAMIKKFKAGVPVYGLFEKRDTRTKYSEYTKMKLEGLPVKTDRNRYAMHHKVIVIDGYRVITGSYNFSRNASRRNDENVVMIDNREIAESYLKEFQLLYR